MPYQVDQTCYDTAQMAAQVSASKHVGGVVVIGSKAYTVSTTSVTGTAITYRMQEVGGGDVFTSANPYTAQPCNLMTASDALAMSWLVVAAWAAVYGVMFLTRALKGETGGDYGNA